MILAHGKKSLFANTNNDLVADDLGASGLPDKISFQHDST